jgi:hypothetical protein
VKTTVIEIPVELKPAIEALVLATANAATEASSSRSVDCVRVESEIQRAAAECERMALQQIVQAADIDALRIRVGDRELVAAHRGEVVYRSAAGPLRVERTLYREYRNGPTWDPLALKFGMVAGTWLPGAAVQMAALLATGTSREAKSLAGELGRLPYSRSSFERVGHVVAGHYVERHADIDEALIAEYEVPSTTAEIAVSLDRVSVPMEEPRDKPAGRPRKGAAKRPVARTFRMAYVGSVTLLDDDGEPLHKICYGRMPQGDAIGLVEGMASDVMMLLRQRPGLAVTVVADGAAEMWALLDAQFNAQTLGVNPRRLIDLYHLLEKLGAAAVALHGEREAKAQRKRWCTRLKSSDTAALRILDELRRDDDGSEAVHHAITYLENNHDRMNYAHAISEARTIGSGAVESTCKSLVTMRLKRPGARWHEQTGEEIVQLRALRLSDRWSGAMELTLRPLRRVVSRAA